MRVLFLNQIIGELGGAEVVVENVRRRSRHTIDLRTPREVDGDTLDDYDAVHVHNVAPAPLVNLLSGRRYVLSLHDYRLDCVSYLKSCLVEGTTDCKRCMGLVTYTRRRRKQKQLRKLVAQATRVVVHSRYMRDYYGHLNPIYLPIPLEVDSMTCIRNVDRGDYLFYSARCDGEKNPLEFVALCRALEREGVMALYNLAGTPRFKPYIRQLRHPLIDIHLNPDRETLFDLYARAHATVHPYRYAEPFGIANANSILLGTPLLSYPHGNLKNLATFTAETPAQLASLVAETYEDPDFYAYLLEKTERMRRVLAEEHDSIARWDELYEAL